MLKNAPIAAVLPAADINRAKNFYTEKLGLEIEKDMETHVLFNCGGNTKLLIYERGPTQVEHTGAGFSVDNVDTEVKELQDKGVVFEEYDMPGIKTEDGVATIGNSKSAWFKDSEGNIVAITQDGLQ